MDLTTQATPIGRVALGTFLGYVIGFERELRGKAAGERNDRRRTTDQPASSTARSNTASSIGSVSLPVNVFCWLGWKQPSRA